MQNPPRPYSSIPLLFGCKVDKNEIEWENKNTKNAVDKFSNVLQTKTTLHYCFNFKKIKSHS